MVVLARALVASPAMAKEGLYPGGGLVINNIVGDDVNVYNSAGGLGLRIGCNFGQVALEGNLVSSDHTADPGYADATFSGFSLDLRVFFSQDQNPARPYFLVGVGGYHLDVDNGNDIDGSGFNMGLGMEYYLNANLALDAAGIYRFIEYDAVNGVPIFPEADGDTFTLAVGLTTTSKLFPV